MNREISLKKFLIILIILIVIEVFVICTINIKRNKNVEETEYNKHCELAVCNESKTICFNYDLDSNGNTIVTWKGSCAK